MLLPVLGQARRKALSVECLNTLRTWGYLFDAYMSDSDERFPPHHTSATSPALPVSAVWNQNLYANYFRSMKNYNQRTLLKCSEFKASGQISAGYAMLTGLHSNIKTRSRVKRPAHVPMVLDFYGRTSFSYNESDDLQKLGAPTLSYTPVPTGVRLMYPHLSKNQQVYVDGHCEARKFHELPNNNWRDHFWGYYW